MSGKSKTAIKQAVAHVLCRIRDNPDVRYHLGFGTEAFSLLTQAYAEAEGIDLKAAETCFTKHPVGKSCRERLDDLGEEIREIMGYHTPESGSKLEKVIHALEKANIRI